MFKSVKTFIYSDRHPQNTLGQDLLNEVAISNIIISNGLIFRVYGFIVCCKRN